ncbi:MAG: Uma2 family endonuclease [Bacteroidia bacterium]|jgi:Uma2 family endonuclease
MKDDNHLIEEPILAYDQLDVNKVYTYLDYMKWRFEERVELIRGKIVKMSPAPNRKHQKLLVNLNSLFINRFKQDSCDWYPAPFDVRLQVPKGSKPITVVQPDICLICDASKLDEQGCDGSPDLMVEILSPSNQQHDLTVKFQLYEEASVPEYWIVDPANRVVLQYSLINGKYVGNKPLTEGSTLVSTRIPDFKVGINRTQVKM